MATPRQSGQELNQNTRRGPNLAIEERDIIIERLASGVTLKECAALYGRTERCIRDLKKKYYQTGTTQDKPRSGRPQILSLRTKKLIIRKARAASKIEYSELAQVGVVVDADGTPSKPPSRSTLYRSLKKQGLTSSRCKDTGKSSAETDLPLHSTS
jgi:transposase